MYERDTVPAVGQIRATVRLHLGRSAARRVQERSVDSGGKGHALAGEGCVVRGAC